MRLLLVILVVAGLITADLRYHSLETTRSFLDTLGTPIYWVANLPTLVGEWTREHVSSRSELIADNERLQRENLLLQGRYCPR